jgi:hypothetical protein
MKNWRFTLHRTKFNIVSAGEAHKKSWLRTFNGWRNLRFGGASAVFVWSAGLQVVGGWR